MVGMPENIPHGRYDILMGIYLPSRNTTRPQRNMMCTLLQRMMEVCVRGRAEGKVEPKEVPYRVLFGPYSSKVGEPDRYC